MLIKSCGLKSFPASDGFPGFHFKKLSENQDLN